jgi:hypothetical protein
MRLRENSTLDAKHKRKFLVGSGQAQCCRVAEMLIFVLKTLGIDAHLLATYALASIEYFPLSLG